MKTAVTTNSRKHLAGSQYSERSEWSELRACSPEAKAEEPAGKALGIDHLAKAAWRAVPWFFACIILLACCSCSTTKHVTQTVRDISKDTIYLTSRQYDSIYIYKDRVTDRSRDTVYLRDISVEYRYKLLRDTVRIVERDSIPYEVTITEVKELTRPLTWFDRLCRYSFFFLLGFILYWIYRRLTPMKL